jgi:hypothetical protein
MSPRKRAFMKVLGAGSRDAHDKNQRHGFCLSSWKLTGYAEVIPGDPIRAITCRVEMWRGGLGAAYLLPALSSAGASLASPCFRFHIPLIEPDVRISRFRLSEKTPAIATAIACDAVCIF